MFCRKCGKQLPDYAAFCGGCGTACLRPAAPQESQEPEEILMPQPPVEVSEPIQAEAPVEMPETLELEVPVEEAAEAETQLLAEEPDAETAEVQADVPAEEAVEELVEEAVEEQEETPAVAPVVAPVEPQPPVTKTKKPRKIRKRPAIGVRILMQFLSFLLCLLLVGSLVATVAVADLRQMTSADGIKRVLDVLLTAPTSVRPVAEHTLPPAMPNSGNGVAVLSDYDFDLDEIPQDILSGGNGEDNINALVDWIYEELQKGNDNKVDFTKEEFQSFVEESTVTDFLSEKLAGFAEDFINGTENTNITTEEVMDLLEENEKELKSELNVELTKEVKQNIQKQVDKVIVEQDINATIRDKVNTAADEALQESLGVDLETARGYLQMITSDLVLGICIGVCVVLLGLLCLVNFYNVPAGLTWGASAGLFVGALMSAPLLIVQQGYDWLVDMVPELANVMGLINSFVSALAPIHYALLIGSAVVLVGSIVWRIVNMCLRNRDRVETAA